MPPVGFEPTVSSGERPKTYALERVAAGTGPTVITNLKKKSIYWISFHLALNFFMRKRLFFCNKNIHSAPTHKNPAAQSGRTTRLPLATSLSPQAFLKC